MKVDYYVRNRNGELKCVLPERLVDKLIEFDKGGWVWIETKTCRARVYQVQKSTALDIRPTWRKETLTIILQQGDTVELVKGD